MSESKRPEPQRRYARTERTRHQLVEAAIGHVAQRGFAGATIADIAETVGISKGVIQYHFGNKPELVRAMVDEVCAVAVARILDDARNAPDPAGRIERFVAAILASRLNDTPGARVLCQLAAIGLEDPELRAIVATRLAADHARLVEFLSEQVTALGVPMAMSVGTIVTLTVALADGLGARKLVAPGEVTVGPEAIQALGRAVFAPR